MVRGAQAAGAELWEDALVKRIALGRRRLDAHACARTASERTVEARYVIGADGAYSTVRKAMFPDAEFGTSAAYREWYPGSPGLDDDWVYVVFPRGEYRPNVWICPKDDGFTLEGAGVKPLQDEIRGLLTRRRAGRRASPRGGTAASAGRSCSSTWSRVGSSPARGNTLLVGDAAGLQFPISGEGIGTALESGLLAADAVAALRGHGRRRRCGGRVPGYAGAACRRLWPTCTPRWRASAR